jgi:hypothetical protein
MKRHPEGSRPVELPGRLLGWGLFLVVGLPAWVLFLLGERECDTHIGAPCTISWGVLKLIAFAIVVCSCAFIGWFTNAVISHIRARNDEVS